ncbi:MAG: V-type ATP synthase subunit D [Verrucomicrobia bacterium]|nr:V-type ATP synthase subunit D [Verrucomicrobiota bacterium]
MSEIKYTKTELRTQQIKLTQLEKYLPTLQLKKALLQLEINQVIGELEKLEIEKKTFEEKMTGYQQLLTDADAENLFQALEVVSINKRFENIAGVEIPIFEEIVFAEPTYFLFDTPYWLESGIRGGQDLIEAREKIEILHERKRLLEKELREVSIRVNLFEKIMIPRTKANIKKVKIFLGDMQLAAVAQTKVAKRKILERKGQQ